MEHFEPEDVLAGHVRRIIEADLVQKEIRCLRAVVWILARENGGGLTLPARWVEMVPDDAALDAWFEDKERTYHIRANAGGGT